MLQPCRMRPLRPPAPRPRHSGSSGGASEGDALPAGHSVIRVPVKVAIKPTVKRTAKLRTVHEVSLHPAWYDCDSRDLSEEEKKWETGSKAKKPKHLLLRHDTKSCIHVLQVNRVDGRGAECEWRADDQVSGPARGEDCSSASSALLPLVHHLGGALRTAELAHGSWWLAALRSIVRASASSSLLSRYCRSTSCRCRTTPWRTCRPRGAARRRTGGRRPLSCTCL